MKKIADIWIFTTLAIYTLVLMYFGYQMALHESDGQIAKSIGIFLLYFIIGLIPPAIFLSIGGFLAFFFFFRFGGVFVCLSTIVAWIDGVPNNFSVPLQYFIPIAVFTGLNIWAAFKSDLPITILE